MCVFTSRWSRLANAKKTKAFTEHESMASRPATADRM
jgi:hypothetical protein